MLPFGSGTTLGSQGKVPGREWQEAMAEIKLATRGAHAPRPSLQNSTGMPSGPGALPECRFRAVNTAPTVTEDMPAAPDCKAGTRLDTPVCCSAALACTLIHHGLPFGFGGNVFCNLHDLLCSVQVSSSIVQNLSYR
jgi:hypothetical protein